MRIPPLNTSQLSNKDPLTANQRTVVRAMAPFRGCRNLRKDEVELSRKVIRYNMIRKLEVSPHAKNNKPSISI